MTDKKNQVRGPCDVCGKSTREYEPKSSDETPHVYCGNCGAILATEDELKDGQDILNIHDYLKGLPHESVGDFDTGRGLIVRRIEFPPEDSYSVDFVLTDSYLRMEMESEKSEALGLNWDSRTTFHDPDNLETLAEELLSAAEWIRENSRSK